MDSLSAHAIFLLSLIALSLVSYVAAYPFCRKLPSAKAKLDAAFEAFLGFYLVSIFAYPTLLGIIDGVVWFATRNFVPVAIVKSQHPYLYWVLEGLGVFVSAIGVAIIGTGIHKIRKPTTNAL
jgi:hypothetical protein